MRVFVTVRQRRGGAGRGGAGTSEARAGGVKGGVRTVIPAAVASLAAAVDGKRAACQRCLRKSHTR